MNKYLATYGKPRFLGIIQLSDEAYADIVPQGLAVVSSHRGEELAEVVGLLTEEQEREYRSLRTISEHGEGPVRGGDPVVTDLNFVRLPTERDLTSLEEHAISEDEILHVAHELVEWHKLQIKLVDAEFLLDEKKLFFYFTSDQRVDFRTLVKDLARRFKTRIELRQMGVRDEARIIRGLSSCGLPCCCSYWLNQFAPIGIRMVKEQNIALNPAKISGICGRLMCCMAFEHKVYKELWEGLPGPGSKIKTPNGNYIVLAIDVGKEALRCHKPTGGDVLVPIELFGEFKQAVLAGEEWEPPQLEEPEAVACKKTSCVGCRTKCENRSPNLRLLQTTAIKRDELRDRDMPEGGESASGEKDAPAHKRSRRRGRRGGRGNRGEGQPVAVANEKKPQEGSEKGKKKQGPKPPRPQAPQNVPESGSSGGQRERNKPEVPAETGEQKAPKRSRRRRRRPKRPGAGVPGSQEITE